MVYNEFLDLIPEHKKLYSPHNWPLILKVYHIVFLLSIFWHSINCISWPENIPLLPSKLLCQFKFKIFSVQVVITKVV